MSEGWARKLAEQEMGIGANLYRRSEEYWVRMLGRTDGGMVFGMLGRCKWKEGMVSGGG